MSRGNNKQMVMLNAVIAVKFNQFISIEIPLEDSLFSIITQFFIKR